ncbi:MAG: hypothetical protein JW866_00900 [Ignavibacteriales bacterium]|nr:hypothetical protein [Ignavibacteriales bacterium]
MKKYFYALLCILFLIGLKINGQDLNEPIEVYIIDSYVTTEEPYKFILSFFTNDSCASTAYLDEKYLIAISEELTDFHKIEIELNNYQFDSTYITYYIFTSDRYGQKYQSDKYDVVIPHKIVIDVKASQSFFEVCCFGGTFFGMPSPGVLLYNGDKYFNLSKELPIASIYSSGFNYPAGYFGVGYTYNFNSPIKHILRVGYKHIFQIPVFEYISVGINYFSNFKGINGYSPEFSVGLFKVYGVFTFNIKYRFNHKPFAGNEKFHELLIDLYSNFFSINL